MIVRILGEGQFEVPDAALAALNQLDAALDEACEAGDEESFRHALEALHEGVKDAGSPVAADYLGPSELVLPGDDATLDEVRALLGDEGLIPD